jgi:hypothetical protein
MTLANAAKPQDLFNDTERDGGCAHLYISDRELHALINPNLGWDRFRATVRAAELRGFPPVRKDWGGRYWPKVKAWLDNDNRVNDHDTIAVAQDGQENFDAPPRKHTRPQTKPVGPSVLDGSPSDAERARFPRSVHSIAGGGQ